MICKSNAAIYRVNSYVNLAGKYTPCNIIVETDAVLHMTYHKPEGKSATATITLPNDVDSIQGHCSQTEIYNDRYSTQIYYADFELNFNEITLEMHFSAKYSMQEWHFDSVNLVYFTSNPLFDYIEQPAQQVSSFF